MLMPWFSTLQLYNVYGSMSKAGWGREPHPVCLGNPVGLLLEENMTPEIWYRRTIGKRIDTDNYPRTNPYQCWDYYDSFCRVIECTASRYCAITGYVGDLWKLRYKYGFDKWFIFVESSEIQEGDWLFWDKHVAFYYNGLEVGQNQNGKPWVTDMPLNRKGLLGAMRYKHWDKPKTGTAECYSKIIAGNYKTTDYVNLRTGGSTDYPIITTLPKNSVVECYGYYHLEKETVWLYVLVRREKGNILGFMCSTYLERI